MEAGAPPLQLEGSQYLRRVDGARPACYPVRVVSRRVPSTILACAALAVYAMAIAATGTLPTRTFGTGVAGTVEARALVDHAGNAVGPHGPRSDEHLTRQRDSRPAGAAHVSLPVAILTVAWPTITLDSGRAFRLESEQERVPTRIVSARTSRGPPDRRS
jgi:hypothetical protein